MSRQTRLQLLRAAAPSPHSRGSRCGTPDKGLRQSRTLRGFVWQETGRAACRYEALSSLWPSVVLHMSYLFLGDAGDLKAAVLGDDYEQTFFELVCVPLRPF